MQETPPGGPRKEENGILARMRRLRESGSGESANQATPENAQDDELPETEEALWDRVVKKGGLTYESGQNRFGSSKITGGAK